MPTALLETIFRARGLSKIHEVGETKVHALRRVDLDLYRRELVVLRCFRH